MDTLDRSHPTVLSAVERVLVDTSKLFLPTLLHMDQALHSRDTSPLFHPTLLPDLVPHNRDT
jgi:hypothetical protein